MPDASPENAQRAELYRAHSKIAADLADSVRTPDERETLLKLATEWLRLATEIDGLDPERA